MTGAKFSRGKCLTYSDHWRDAGSWSLELEEVGFIIYTLPTSLFTPGIGRGIVVKLHSLGAKVTALSRTQGGLDTLALECPGIVKVVADVSDWKAVQEILASLAPFDALVNNAGVARCDDFLDVTPDAFDL